MLEKGRLRDRQWGRFRGRQGISDGLCFKVKLLRKWEGWTASGSAGKSIAARRFLGHIRQNPCRRRRRRRRRVIYGNPVSRSKKRSRLDSSNAEPAQLVIPTNGPCSLPFLLTLGMRHLCGRYISRPLKKGRWSK